MIATFLSLLGGILAKTIQAGFSKWMENSYVRNLSTSTASIETIKAIQSGHDRADWTARITRILLVLPIVYVFLYLSWYIVVFRPDLSYTIETNRFMSPFWQFLLPFPINEKGFVTITGAFIMERLWLGVWFILGFYVTKMGR